MIIIKKIAAIVAALVLITGFIYPMMAFVLAINIMKFGGIYLVLDIACKMVCKKHIIEIIRDGLNDEEDDYY